MAKGIRGERVFRELMLFDMPEEPKSDERERGRSADKIAARNEHLLYRYCWYQADNSRRHGWIVERLADEFYLTESTVGQIIEASGDNIRLVKRKMKAAPGVLKEKWGWFRW